MRLCPLPYDVFRLLAVVSFEQCREPVAGEENVAGALYLLEYVESRHYVFVRLWLVSLAVEQSQRCGSVWLGAPVFSFQQVEEKLFA